MRCPLHAGFSFSAAWFDVVSLPGCAPGRAVTFSCVPKRKSPKRRAAEVRAPAGYLALLASGGVGLNSLRSDNARPDPPAAALLSPATRHRGPNSREPNSRTPQGRAMARPCCLGFWYSVPHCRVRRRVAQARAEKEVQMSEPAGRVSALPALAEQRSVPGAQRRDDAPGSPFFAYFLWRSKESECAVGRITRHQTRRRSETRHTTPGRAVHELA